MVTLGELATYLGSPLPQEQAGTELDGIAPIERADARSLAFIADSKYLPALRDTRAGCVLVKEEWREESPVPVLCVADPYLAYARASALFEPDTSVAPGVHATAVIDGSVDLPERIAIGPYVCIEGGVRLGSDVSIGAGTFIGRGAELGEGTRIEPGVVIYHGVSIGRHCRVHASTVIGADGFGFARKSDGWQKISQLGSVRIGDFVDIGASSTVDRGALDDTIIHDHVIIDDQVHIAHNCIIGERTAIAGCVGIAGSVTVGADCTFAGQVGVSGHLDICDNVHLTGQARVTGSVTEPGSYASGTPLEAHRRWARNAVRFTQLNELQKRVMELEARLERLAREEADGG